MCVCVCMCVWVCVCTYIYIYVRVCDCVHLHTSSCVNFAPSRLSISPVLFLSTYVVIISHLILSDCLKGAH